MFESEEEYFGLRWDVAEIGPKVLGLHVFERLLGQVCVQATQIRFEIARSPISIVGPIEVIKIIFEGRFMVKYRLILHCRDCSRTPREH